MSLTWTLPASASLSQTALVAHAKETIPAAFTFARPLDDLDAFGTVFAWVFRIVEHYLRLTLIDASVGPWLVQHARDRLVYPQGTESPDVLRQRARSFPDAVTVPAIKARVDELLGAAGVPGTSAIYEPGCQEGSFFGYDGMSETEASYFFSYYDTSAYPSPDGIAYTLWELVCAQFIVYVPAATPDNVLAAIEDAVRLMRGAGILATVERTAT